MFYAGYRPQNLLAILGPKKGIPTLAVAHLQRWAVMLSGYLYDIEYKSAQQHGNADGLSRLPLKRLSGDSVSQQSSIFFKLKPLQ